MKTRLHLHRYGPWEEKVAMYSSPFFPKLGQWQILMQVRQCKKCGKIKTRDIG
jgi:hypothetical protein